MSPFELIEDRAQRLQAINAFLDERNLGKLERIGICERGEIEILRILEVRESHKRWLIDIVFETKIPTPNGPVTGSQIIRFNANGKTCDGFVFVVLINGRFAIAKQFRPNRGVYSWGVPRSFNDHVVKAQQEGNLAKLGLDKWPFYNMIAELGPEMLAGATVNSVADIGSLMQNDGTDHAMPTYFFVDIKVDENKLQQRLQTMTGEGIKLRLLTYEEFDDAIGETIKEQFSVSVLKLYEKHVRRAKAMAEPRTL